MKILVTGGAGYIGSHMTKALLDRGDSVVVADSLERGHKEFVDERALLEVGDLKEKEFVSKLFANHQYDAVIHFAAYIAVGESMEMPGLYFQNNLVSALNVLDAMIKHNVPCFIFSSTGTVYGTPTTSPISETHPKNPENPYSQTKSMIEDVMGWYSSLSSLSCVALRYFNAAGADTSGIRGEMHAPETHLIPNAIAAAKEGKVFTLFGTDYETRDGTCIRDYIHVVDLVTAHLLALDQLKNTSKMHIYNVGTGNGHTNKEVLAAVERVSGKKIEVTASPRRPGDVSSTVADPNKIKQELGFEPKYSSLDSIVESAWNWHTKTHSTHEG